MTNVRNKQIAILVYDMFEQVELTGPKQELEAAGATVHIVAPDAGSVQGLHKIDPADTFPVDVTLADMQVSDYDGVVVPGGVINADYLRMVEAARQVMRDFNSANKPMAVICHGPWLLVSAGLVSGRRLTSYYTLQNDIRNAGGEWEDEEVVVDGNLITSRNPDDLPAFNQALLVALDS